MTVTVTDLFCGAGGSSIGATAAGATLVMAANHWQTAIDVHQSHFPDAAHDLADVSQADPRRYPRTDLLLASPECTNHSQARGVSRKRQNPGFWDAPDPSAKRSRATMWDVIRFAEQMHYPAMVVENVVEATKWVLWPAWVQALGDLGYEHRVISANSMFHGVAQSRDRLYVACWRKGLRPQLDAEQTAWCPRCEIVGRCRQSFKNGRQAGRYGSQWVWSCASCSTTVSPSTVPAADIIDWPLDCPPIGDRARALAPATRARILAGLQRYGFAPITTAGAGNVYETTPGNRARSILDPLPVQQATATTALATPPGFLMNTWHQGRTHPLDQPHPTVCAADDRLSLVIPMRNHGQALPTSAPLPTVTSGGNHHGLLMRNNSSKGEGAEICTPTSEPARTMTTTSAQSLLRRGEMTGADVERLVDSCGFRMLEPHEIAAAMAFPEGYIPAELPKKDRVRLAGNAVTPPVMAWLTGRMIQAMESAA